MNENGFNAWYVATGRYQACPGGSGLRQNPWVAFSSCVAESVAAPRPYLPDSADTRKCCAGLGNYSLLQSGVRFTIGVIERVVTYRWRPR